MLSVSVGEPHHKNMVRITKQSLHDPGKERRVIIRKHKQSLSQNAYSPVEGLDQSSILKPYPSLGKGIPVQLSLPISLPVSPKEEKQTNKQNIVNSGEHFKEIYWEFFSHWIDDVRIKADHWRRNGNSWNSHSHEIQPTLYQKIMKCSFSPKFCHWTNKTQV